MRWTLGTSGVRHITIAAYKLQAINFITPVLKELCDGMVFAGILY